MRLDGRPGDSGREQPEGAGGSVGHPERSEERRADGLGGDDRRSGHDLGRGRRVGRARYRASPGRVSRGPDAGSGRGCEIHSGVRIVDSTVDDRVVINNFCVIRESVIESGAEVGPFAQLRPASKVSENAPRRQLRRDQEDDARPRVEGEPPRLPRRRHDRREGQHRRRHDHLQLRRRAQAPDDHRGRRVHRLRQRSSSRRSGSGRAPTSPPARRSPRTCRPTSLAIARGKQVNKPGWIAARTREARLTTETDDATTAD